MKIRFVRNFTLESMELWLQRELRPSGISIECTFGGFAEAVDDVERLGAARDDLIVLALGLEMTAAEFGRSDWAAAEACERTLMLARAAVKNGQGPLIINTVLPPLFSATGMANTGEDSHALLVDRLNVELRELAGANPDRVSLVDWGGIARELGERDTYDHRYWQASGAPFAAPFLRRYAAAIAGVVRALSGKVRKCLVLDCDNTLWGGVVGEVGLDGIQLSADINPGSHYQQFQRAVIDLQRRGVAVALCSKNNESDVFEVLDSHPDCLLKREHLSAWRIDWNDKSQSIVAIAEELNLALDALVFVDDSPQECEVVRAALPEVVVLQAPESPEELVGFLERRHLFDSLAITAEDRRRTSSYRENSARRELSRAVCDLSEYKHRLGTRLRVRSAEGQDRARVAQLLQRTNQFNVTTRRHSESDVVKFMADPDKLVVVAELEDRFGDLGLVGCGIAQHEVDVARIDTMLMSCRALGRDAEVAFAAGLFRLLIAKWGVRRVLAEYIPSAKNAVVKNFWTRVGLEPKGDAGIDGKLDFASTSDLAQLAASIVPLHVTLLETLDG